MQRKPGLIYLLPDAMLMFFYIVGQGQGDPQHRSQRGFRSLAASLQSAERPAPLRLSGYPLNLLSSVWWYVQIRRALRMFSSTLTPRQVSTGGSSRVTEAPRPSRRPVMRRSRWDITGLLVPVAMDVVSSLPINLGVNLPLTKTSMGTQVIKASYRQFACRSVAKSHSCLHIRIG